MATVATMATMATGQEEALRPRYGARYVRDVRVPLPDGITLAADLFVPDAPASAAAGGTWDLGTQTLAGVGPYPLLLEYLPYRKNDTSWLGHYGPRYLAERGFVVAKLDVRGTGDSEGTALDEYCPQEQLDGVAAIAWFAAQPWCTGKVGMFGTSYGGFNSLQVAMHRPPALAAICPMYFTDRRYTDDCHYKGGAMQMMYDVGTYGLSMVGRNLLPPRPDLTSERWAAIWEQHLQNEPWLLRWLAHQTEDEQWRHGSLCEDYGAVRCPSFLIGGWRDGYTNCNLRTYEHLTCPKKLLIGPWLHARPYDAVPGPRINHWREMARFFGHWLEGRETGIMEEPPITIYVQQHDSPRPDRRETSGYWRSEAEWPLARARDATYHLGDGTLADRGPGPAGSSSFEYVPWLGTSFGIFSGGGPFVLPGDQRAEEAYAAVFTSSPLEAPLEILGRPRAALRLDTTADVITFVVRLCDVAPDSSSALVTKGVLNATHRESHRHPTPLVPGRVYTLEIELDATSWVFEPGHRIRLSLSNADFPNTWPSPEPATSRLHWGAPEAEGEAIGAPRPASCLILPTVLAATRSLPVPAFEPGAPQAPGVTWPPGTTGWRVSRDLLTGQAEVTIGGEAEQRIDERLVQRTRSTATATVAEGDPARAGVRGRREITYRWPDHTFAVTCNGQIESDATAFHVAIHAEVTMAGRPHFSRHWVASYPRRLL